MAKIILPRILNDIEHTGMVRSIKEGTKQFPYELKITLDIAGAHKNMYIGLEKHDMDSIIYHLKALGLIKESGK